MIKELKTVLPDSARFIGKKRNHEHITPILIEFHLLYILPYSI